MKNHWTTGIKKRKDNFGGIECVSDAIIGESSTNWINTKEASTDMQL